MSVEVAAASRPRKRRFPVPLLEGIRPFEGKRIPTEIVAGITLAALAIPEVMGYTTIAGMPVITGLYTIVLPVFLFALLGSSRHLVVGADSATAAIMAAGLASLATPASATYVALAGMIALIVGAFLLLARILRLGFLADFLSRTVLIGFLTGVGIQVACGQFSGLFGIPKSGSGPIMQVVSTFQNWSEVSWTTFAVSISVILVIVVGGRLVPRVPWALIAVIGALIASWAFSLSSHGVSTLGTVPSGLPSLSFPSIPSGDLAKLLGTAVSIFVVVLAQSAATSRAYAAKFDDDFDENVDLIGLSAASFGAGLTGTFVVNGSPTKTAMVDKAGGRSQLAQLCMAVVVIIVLLFLTVPLSYLPNAVLAAVVFLIGIELVDAKGMRKILRLRPAEFLVALITAATVIFVGVEQGIILAIVISIIVHLRHSYRPYDRLMFPQGGGDWGDDDIASGAQAAEGLLVYRFGASLYYANASRFAAEVRDSVAKATGPVRWFCLAASSIEDLDYSGSAVLRATVEALGRQGVTFVASDVQDPVLAQLKRDGLFEIIGEEHVFGGLGETLRAYQGLPSAGGGTVEQASVGSAEGPSEGGPPAAGSA
jgi:high affinity sulfate transporter 1